MCLRTFEPREEREKEKILLSRRRPFLSYSLGDRPKNVMENNVGCPTRNNRALSSHGWAYRKKLRLQNEKNMPEPMLNIFFSKMKVISKAHVNEPSMSIIFIKLKRHHMVKNLTLTYICLPSKSIRKIRNTIHNMHNI